MIVSAIVAVSENNVIGKDNRLVWHLPEDIRFFKEKTMGHCVVSGRKNYESIPEKFRPLKGRTNIVVTRQKDYEAPGAIVVHSVEEAIAVAKEKGEKELFIIGGAEIYNQTMEVTDRLYLTRVFHTFEGDAYFPEVPVAEWEQESYILHTKDSRHAYDFAFIVLNRKR
ncbi:MAG: dihydrofolate reductase [Bacteroidota bacterium]